MTREEQLKYCSVCTKRGFDRKHGIVCGLTNAPATFEVECKDYEADEKEVQLEKQKVNRQKKEVNKAVNRGRIALFIIGGLYVLVGFVESFVILGADILFGIIDWFVAAIFIGLGIWSYKNPFLALVIGLCFYVAIMLLLAAIDPATIVQGIIWKILIITSLVYSIQAARSEEKKHKKPAVDLLDQI